MIRLRATKHQRNAVKPGGSSETTQPRAATRSYSAPPRRGYGDVGPAGEDRDGRRADVRVERADVRGRVDAERHAGDDGHPGGGEPAPERARDLDAVRRAAARADDRHPVAARPARASRPATWSTAGGSASSRSAAG